MDAACCSHLKIWTIFQRAMYLTFMRQTTVAAGRIPPFFYVNVKSVHPLKTRSGIARVPLVSGSLLFDVCLFEDYKEM